MLDSFLIRAGLGGLGVALAAGPLGAFVVWRRMAYFADATAHAAILGVALAFAAGLPVAAGVALAALGMALLLARMARGARSADATLGVLSHSALALGLVAASLVPGLRGDLSAWLFGDILSIGRGDVALIWGVAATVLALLAWRWDRLVLTALNADLARSAGIDPRREELVLTVAVALFVAAGIQLVGALLAAALMIVPAAAARGLARTPESMALWAAGLGMLAVLAGLAASLQADLPAGPAIVAAAAGLYALALLRRSSD